MQIRDAFARFEVQLRADGRSEHTRKQYARHVALLGSWLTGARHSGEIQEIDDGDVARFLASDTVRLTASGTLRAPGSANALRTSVVGFFRYLHDAGLVHPNPARLVRRALTAPPPPRAIRLAEQERLLSVLRAAEGAAARRDLVLVEVMLASGIRLSSALALDVADVDLDEATLRLRNAKGNRELKAYLPRPACDLLRKHLGDRKVGPVFGSVTGRRLTARHVQRRFRGWRGAAGLPGRVTPHSLRHGFAIDLYRRTGDVLVVKQALGHRAVSSTLCYAQADEQRVRAAVGA